MDDQYSIDHSISMILLWVNYHFITSSFSGPQECWGRIGVNGTCYTGEAFDIQWLIDRVDWLLHNFGSTLNSLRVRIVHTVI